MADREASVQAPLILGPEDIGRVVSAEEFASAEFVGSYKYERAGGRLIVMAPDGTEHIRASNPWRDRLIFYKHQHPGVVEEVVTGAWVRVEGGTDRIGDIGVYLVKDPPTFAVPDQVPDLMFEVVSPGRESRDRDYVEKRDEYHRLGVREYVIIDRFAGAVTVLTHAPEGYLGRVLERGGVYTSPLLPGLAIPLAEVLPELS
jgi:Uma2 family endonuclease